MSASVPLLSPCIGICELDAGGVCEGCLRTVAEIATWSAMGAEERQRLMDEVLPAREAGRG